MGRRPKIGRTVRRRRTSAGFSERDSEILECVCALRFASAAQVALAMGISIDRSRRILRRQFDLGFLAIRLISSTEPNLISISRKGLDLLKRERPEAAGRVRPCGPIRLADVPRHLLLTDVRMFAVDFLSARGTPLVRWSAGATPDRRHGLAGLQPDAMMELTVPDGLAAIAVEADAGAASSDSVLRRIGRYPAVAAAGKVDALWIASSGSRTRILAIERRIEEAGLSRWARVLPREALLRRPATLPDGAVAEAAAEVQAP